MVDLLPSWSRYLAEAMPVCSHNIVEAARSASSLPVDEFSKELWKGAPNALAASFQCSLVIHNPSGRASARYDRLTAYVVYRGEAITSPAELPPLVQDPDSTVVVSPVIGGGGAPPVPVSPDTAAALANDVSYGVVSLRVVLLGRVRFVSGPFRRGWPSMYARCDLLVGVRNKGPGVGVAGLPEAPLLGNPSCVVDM